MTALLNWPFGDEDVLKPRIGVAAGLLAYVLQFVRPYLGTTSMALVTIVIIASLALACYGVLRLLMPMMDPRDPDADRFVVWGGLALFVLVGAASFGLWFIPGFLGGAGLIWWRVRELVEVFPWFEERGNVDIDTVEAPGERPRIDLANPADRLRR